MGSKAYLRGALSCSCDHKRDVRIFDSARKFRHFDFIFTRCKRIFTNKNRLVCETRHIGIAKGIFVHLIAVDRINQYLLRLAGYQTESHTACAANLFRREGSKRQFGRIILAARYKCLFRAKHGIRLSGGNISVGYRTNRHISLGLKGIADCLSHRNSLIILHSFGNIDAVFTTCVKARVGEGKQRIDIVCRPFAFHGFACGHIDHRRVVFHAFRIHGGGKLNFEFTIDRNILQTVPGADPSSRRSIGIGLQVPMEKVEICRISVITPKRVNAKRIGVPLILHADVQERIGRIFFKSRLNTVPVIPTTVLVGKTAGKHHGNMGGNSPVLSLAAKLNGRIAALVCPVNAVTRRAVCHSHFTADLGICAAIGAVVALLIGHIRLYGGFRNRSVRGDHIAFKVQIRVFNGFAAHGNGIAVFLCYILVVDGGKNAGGRCSFGKTRDTDQFIAVAKLVGIIANTTDRRTSNLSGILRIGSIAVDIAVVVGSRHGNIGMVEHNRGITAEGKADKMGSSFGGTYICRSGRLGCRHGIYGCLCYILARRIDDIQTARIIQRLAIGFAAVLRTSDRRCFLPAMSHHIAVGIDLRGAGNTLNAARRGMIISTSGGVSTVISIIYHLDSRDLFVPRIHDGIQRTKRRVLIRLPKRDITGNAIACGKKIHIACVHGNGRRCLLSGRGVFPNGKLSTTHKIGTKLCQTQLDDIGTSIGVPAVVNDDNGGAVTGFNSSLRLYIVGYDTHVAIGTDSLTVPVDDIKNNISLGRGIFCVEIYGKFGLTFDICVIRPHCLILFVAVQRRIRIQLACIRKLIGFDLCCKNTDRQTCNKKQDRQNQCDCRLGKFHSILLLWALVPLFLNI